MIRLALACLLLALPAAAREAAFVDPNANTGRGNASEALVPEPKELDTGESVVGVSRRTTLFFSNASALPVTISNITLNFDSNVAAEIVSDDCQKLGKIPSGNRCALALSINPNSPGPWSVEVLVTHDGIGRISRALLNGITLGERRQVQERQMGLALSATKIDPVDFGDVEVGSSEAVRSALVFNDSADDLTILGIDLIAPTNGLERLEQGCELDMTLRTNESCPITVRWAPQNRTNISTDVIVRHTGRTGFMVIPLRGKATGGEAMAATPAPARDRDDNDERRVRKTDDVLPPPPTAAEIAQLTAAMPPVSALELKKSDVGSAGIELIGTIGQRAIVKLGDISKVLELGTSVTVGTDTLKLMSIDARRATVELNGNSRELTLRQAQSQVMTIDSGGPKPTGAAGGKPPIKGGT